MGKTKLATHDTMKVDRVCIGESLVSSFSFTLGGKDLQTPSDKRMSPEMVWT
jgi:hypothetical protein